MVGRNMDLKCTVHEDSEESEEYVIEIWKEKKKKKHLLVQGRNSEIVATQKTQLEAKVLNIQMKMFPIKS